MQISFNGLYTNNLQKSISLQYMWNPFPNVKDFPKS